MTMPNAFEGRLKVPAIASPMFLASGPDLVVATCRAGVIGTFPALNQRTTEGYGEWLSEIEDRLSGHADAAPYGVNLIVHRSNKRLEADLAMTVEHKVPLVITSLGANPDVVSAVHSYGGLVFHDVINPRHARKAAEAGVDGIIAGLRRCRRSCRHHEPLRAGLGNPQLLRGCHHPRRRHQHRRADRRRPRHGRGISPISAPASSQRRKR